MTNFESWNEPLELNTMRIEQNNTEKPIIMLTNENQIYNNPENYKVISGIGHGGGAVVLFPQDIAFYMIVEKSIMSEVLVKLKQYIGENFNIYSEIMGNDLCIEGYKILGSTITNYGEYLLEGFFISFTSDIDIINNVSCKAINKIPKGALSYGITPEKILEFLHNIAKDYSIDIVE